MSDNDVQSVSQNVFKNCVRKKVKIKHLEYLNNWKKKHTKSTHLDCTDHKDGWIYKRFKVQSENKQLLFKLRSRTLDVKANFKNGNQNPWCSSCGLFAETQGHLLQCPTLVQNLHYLRGKTSKLNESDIYSTIEKQEIIVNIYSDILEVRENLKEDAVKWASRHQTQQLTPLRCEGPVHLVDEDCCCSILVSY